VLVLVTWYMGEPEPVCFEVTEGETGIPVFDTVEHAEEFANAYRQLLDPDLEVLELPDYALAQLLSKCTDKTEYVIFHPKPVWPSSGTVWWEMVDIRQFADGLGESSP
jgi:hypothetical protein